MDYDKKLGEEVSREVLKNDVDDFTDEFFVYLNDDEGISYEQLNSEVSRNLLRNGKVNKKEIKNYLLKYYKNQFENTILRFGNTNLLEILGAEKGEKLIGGSGYDKSVFASSFFQKLVERLADDVSDLLFEKMESNKEIFEAIKKGLWDLDFPDIKNMSFFNDLVKNIKKLKESGEEDIYGEILYTDDIGEEMKNTIKELGYDKAEDIASIEDNDGYQQNSIDDLIIQFTDSRNFHEGFAEYNDVFDNNLETLKDLVYDYVKDYDE